MWEGVFFSRKWVKLTQSELFSIFEREHILRVQKLILLSQTSFEEYISLQLYYLNDTITL